MQKFYVRGDNTNPYFSSSIIVDGLNKGAKEAELYDESGKLVVYSTTCDTYGYSPDVIYCLYETLFPFPLIQRAAGRPIIGSCLHNLFFISDVYPPTLAGYCPLGVDTDVFKPIKRKENPKFRFLSFTESNARNGIDVILEAFRHVFSGREDTELYLKDRNATDTFKQYVADFAKQHKIQVIHDTTNTQSFEDVKEIYANADVNVSASRTSTWNLPCIEGMAMGLPLIGVKYTGVDEYLRHEFNGWAIDYGVDIIAQEKIDDLVKKGYRNHMFPLQSYPYSPYWAEPSVEDMVIAMAHVRNLPKKALNYFSNNAIYTANYFTWKRAAILLSYQLDLFQKNATNSSLATQFNRYS